MNPLRLLSKLLGRNTSQSQSNFPYGLDHAILNTPIPPPSMWMNVGYWKNTDDFPTACAALLDQVLITAGLIDEAGGAVNHPPGRRLRLLDVGIGCGDQSLRVLGYKRKCVVGREGEEKDEKHEESLFDSYVGITSLPVQAEYATKRVEDIIIWREKETGTEIEDEKHGPEKQAPRLRARIFCADAAKPSSWSTEIHPLLNPNLETKGKEEEDSTWLLALDTLYHFTPSRTPLFKYTNSTLTANIMAFDLLLPSTPLSLIQRILLRLLCLITRTPYSNFLTREQYTALLVAAGYDESKISFRDISGDVFSGIAGYIRKRQEMLRMYGMGGGMGKFKGAKVVFGWWARTGVVRGVIVVARV
ncbi:hypothetical protein BJX99DRAFT_45520 [Aspergillus californicus]